MDFQSLAGADTVRFKAEINFDGREITRRHLSRKETAQLLQVRWVEKWTINV
jgi:hypothetical protein